METFRIKIPLNFPLENESLIKNWIAPFLNGWKYNLSILSAHILDATSTFISVDFYGFSEQHLLPNFIYLQTGTSLLLLPYKIAIILFSIYLIDTNINNNKTLNESLKLAIFVLGLAPALRNILNIILV